MTSRSIASLSSVVLALVLLAAPASAGRKIVVLEFEGPKAEKFHDDVEAAIKKSASILALDKWLDKAEDLDATKLNAKNIKKIARKLKVDGVVMGEVEKRGQRYYVHLKLREGISGEYVAEVEIVVRSPKLGAEGAKTVKEELIPAIKDLVSISGDDDEDDDEDADSGDDDEDEDGDSRAKRRKKGFGGGDDDDEDADADDDDDDEDADSDDDEEEDDRAAAKEKAKKKKAKEKAAKEKAAKEKAAKEKAKKEKAAKEKAKKEKARKKKEQEESDDEDDDAITSHFGDDDDEDADSDDDQDADSDDDDEDSDDGDDDDRVADEDDGDDDDDGDGEVRRRHGGGGDDDDEVMDDPRSRPVDFAAGMSVTARRLGFTTAAGTGPVQGYTGNPVAGVVVAGTVYPLAFNKKNKSLTRDFGLTLLFDRVVKISSKIKYDDMGEEATAVLGTVQQRFSFGVVFRHLLGEKASIQGSVRFNKMKFVIDKDAAPVGVTVQIPNVDYTFIDPGVAVKYIAMPKLVVDAALSVGLVLDTGEMQQADQFGAAKVIPIDFVGGGTYAVTDKIVIRGEARATTFGFSFNGTGAMNDLDGDGEGDVPSGRDTYFGAMVGAGYIF